MPDFNARMNVLMTKMGMPGEYFVHRMTGCPNGCAPPETHPPETLDLEPLTVNPTLKPSTRNPEPCTFNPEAYTLNPQPSTFNPQPSTLNPNPAPSSLKP